MPTTESCPSCNERLRVPNGFTGGCVKCPSCQGVFSIPARERLGQQPAPEGVEPVAGRPPPVVRPDASPPPPTPTEWFSLDRLLALLSVGWLFLIAVKGVDSQFAVWVTLALLAVDAGVGVGVLVSRRRIPFLLNLAQLALFCLAHSQVYTVWGSHHYATERPPTTIDWVQFTAAHVLRAADVLDLVEEYSVDIQRVKHASGVSGVLLVAMHLTVDVFLIGLFVRAGRKLWTRLRRWQKDRAPRSTEREQLRREAARAERWARILKVGKAVSLVACAIGYVLTGVVQKWGGADWALWPVDTVLRLVDVADAMNVFHWRLHGVPSGLWLSTLAVLLRLSVGLYLAEAIVLVRLRVLRGAMRTVEELIEDLTHFNPAVRRAAVVIAGGLGAESPGIVPSLVAALADADPGVRHAAAEALGQVGPPAVPSLVVALADANPDIRDASTGALWRIVPNWWTSPRARDAVPTLVAALVNMECGVRSRAADVLGQIGPAAESAVPALVAALADAEGEVREGAAKALGSVGPAAESAVPALVAALADARKDVRSKAADALGKLRARDAVPSLVVALADADTIVRYAAASALGKIGPPAASALPALAAALADRHPSVRRLAAEALEKIGAAAASAAPSLLAAQSDKAEHVRQAASSALEQISRTAP